MTKNNTLLAVGLSSLAFGLTGCPTDPAPTDAPGTDAPIVPTDTNGADAPVASDGCTTYCTQMTAHCSGANAQYDDMAECLSYCGAAGWPVGTPGEAGGNTLSCRIYHSGDPAMADAAMHCPHAGPSGAGVCGAPVTFRSDAAGYVRVDRMGMPAVATALVASTRRNAYNDANPSDDATLTFAGDLIGSLTSLHDALDTQLTGLGLSVCSMSTTVGGLPECVGQEVAAGVSVASLVVPDTLQVNPGAPSGFPNGRELDDAVIDPTLSLIFLKLGASCGASPCGPGTIHVNPAANDATFSTTFPYLAPIHAP